MAPSYEVNSKCFGTLFNFLHNNCMLSVLIRNRLDEAILMSTHNIQLHNKIRKFP